LTGHVSSLLGDARAAEELLVAGLKLAKLGLTSRVDSSPCRNENTKQERAEMFEQAHRLRSNIQFAAPASVAFAKLAEIHEKVCLFVC